MPLITPLIKTSLTMIFLLACSADNTSDNTSGHAHHSGPQGQHSEPQGQHSQQDPDRPLHHPDVNVDIHRPLPDEVAEEMVPGWFDASLFPSPGDPIDLDEQQWRERLSRSEYYVLRSEGTEPPYVSEYHGVDTEGVYVCRACSNPLFTSRAKFHSSSGWPSYFEPISRDHIGVKPDNSFWMQRTEVHCARCGSHIGHVFDDGSEPTGLRYCMNSRAMRLIDREAHDKIADGRESELGFTLNR